MQLTIKLNISDCHQLDSNRLMIGHNSKKWVRVKEEDEETIIIIIINYISLQSDVGHYIIKWWHSGSDRLVVIDFGVLF